MIDDDNDGEGRNNESAREYSSLVAHTRRMLAVSYALEERLRATGHLRGFAVGGPGPFRLRRRVSSPTPPLAAAA